MLQLDDVWAGYGPGAPVLQGCSLRVGTSELVAILGRNGVGKSTLMRTIIGMVRATRGSITLDDRELVPLPSYRRARLGLGYAPQGREVFPALSVLDNLLVAANDNNREANRHVEAILEEFPLLKALLRRRAGSLSGGQQQVLVLARALMGRPKLLLLDEPTEGIQPSIVDEIRNHVRAINHRWGIAIFFAEQNLSFAAGLAQRVYAMDKGRIVREISPEAVLADEELQHELLGV
jgi:urea transport system ATP-binding protein